MLTEPSSQWQASTTKKVSHQVLVLSELGFKASWCLGDSHFAETLLKASGATIFKNFLWIRSRGKTKIGNLILDLKVSLSGSFNRSQICSSSRAYTHTHTHTHTHTQPSQPPHTHTNMPHALEGKSWTEFSINSIQSLIFKAAAEAETEAWTEKVEI